MFTLIKREIQDHVLYLTGSVVLAVILIVILTTFALQQGTRIDWDDLIAPVIPFAIIIMLGFCAMGVSQMYTDRNRRISAFISTLPVRRNRILLAKLLTGTLAILMLLAPLAITAIILFRLFSPPIPIFDGVILDVFIGSFLMAFACYCIGLQSGANSGKPGPALCGLALTLILITLVVVKGFGAPMVLILVLFIIASLIRIWHIFTSTSL